MWCGADTKEIALESGLRGAVAEEGFGRRRLEKAYDCDTKADIKEMKAVGGEVWLPIWLEEDWKKHTIATPKLVTKEIP